MEKFDNVDWVISGLALLAQDEYSFLWQVIEDFECNGHIVSVKGSKQWNHIIVDDVYYRIGGKGTISRSGDPNQYTYLEYLKKYVLA